MRLDLADGAQLVRRVPRDADVVGALDRHLEVAGLENLATARRRQPACGFGDVIHERISRVECSLQVGNELDFVTKTQLVTG